MDQTIEQFYFHQQENRSLLRKNLVDSKKIDLLPPLRQIAARCLVYLLERFVSEMTNKQPKNQTYTMPQKFQAPSLCLLMIWWRKILTALSILHKIKVNLMRNHSKTYSLLRNSKASEEMKTKKESLSSWEQVLQVKIILKMSWCKKWEVSNQLTITLWARS
mgnify:FL=1